MLRHNSLNKTVYTRQGPNSRALYDVESLRAAYQAVAEASAATSHAQPFSAEKTFHRFTDTPNPPKKTAPQPLASSDTRRNADRNNSELDFPFFSKTRNPAPFESIPAKSSQPDNARPAAFKSTKSFKPPFQDVDGELLALPPHEESLLVKVLSKPKPVVLIIGLCLLASSVYAGLGCWWLASGYAAPASQTSVEPVNLMSVQEEDANATPVKKLSLKNIQAIQDQPAIIVPKEPSTEPDALSIGAQGTLLAQADAPTNPKATTAPTVTGIKTNPPELTGRPDPFAPLIQINSSLPNAPTAIGTTKKDVLEDLQYTGFIGNANAKNKLAIIKVPNPAGGPNLTLIKKVGAAFLVEGERIVLRGITKQALQLSVSGQTRTLTLAPYQEIVASSPNSSDDTTGSGQSASDSTSTSKTATGSTTSNSNSSSPQLQEP